MAEKKMQGFRARLDYVLKHNYFVFKVFNFSVSYYQLYKATGFIPTASIICCYL